MEVFSKKKSLPVLLPSIVLHKANSTKCNWPVRKTGRIGPLKFYSYVEVFKTNFFKPLRAFCSVVTDPQVSADPGLRNSGQVHLLGILGKNMVLSWRERLLGKFRASLLIIKSTVKRKFH